MSSAREVKRRIKSVKNTMQITRAMQMIAATKMRRAQEAAETTREYAQGLFEIVNKIGGVPEDYTSTFFRQAEKIKNIAIILIGPLKGFSGGLPTNLLLHTDAFIQTLTDETGYENAKVKIIAVNKVGHKLAQNLAHENIASFLDLTDHPTLNDIEPIYHLVVDLFQKEETDEVYVSYPKFVSTLQQEPEIRKILPITEENIEEQARPELAETKPSIEPVFEPSVKEVLDDLLPKYLRIQIFQGLLNLIASEYSARMVAMKNATDNAKELVEDLTLVYNQTRQNGITSELLEISASAM